VNEWLAHHGITIGIKDDDVVAAVWFTNAFAPTNPDLPEKGNEAREEEFNRELERIRIEGIRKGSGGLSKLRVSPPSEQRPWKAVLRITPGAPCDQCFAVHRRPSWQP